MSGLQNRTLNCLERLADLTRALVTIRAFLRQAALDHCCQLVWSRAASWTSFSKASLSSGVSPFWASSIMFVHSMGVRAIVVAFESQEPKARFSGRCCHENTSVSKSRHGDHYEPFGSSTHLLFCTGREQISFSPVMKIGR